MFYADYLKNDHWKNKRREKLLNSPDCQICNSTTGIHIHHKKYKNGGESILFNERMQDLITLCSSCHRLIHHYFGIEVPKINKKILRIRRLIELGVPKKRAFYFATQTDLFYRVRDYMVSQI